MKKLCNNPQIAYLLLAVLEIPAWFLLIEGHIKPSAIAVVVLLVVLANGAMIISKQNPKKLVVSEIENRNAVYDWIRLAAMCLVIITHSVQYTISVDRITDHLMTYRVVYLLAFACNPLFLLLTGALVLPKKDISLREFYTRRVPRIVISLMVYLLLIQWKYGQIDKKNLIPSLWDSLKKVYTGEGGYMPILNFMTIVLAIYLLIPFLSRMVQSLTFTQLSVLLFMCFCSDVGKHFLPVHPTYRFLFSGYVGVCMMGYWLTREEAAKYRWLIRVLSLISIGVVIYWVYYDLSYSCIVTDSPVLYILAAEIFNEIYYHPDLFRSHYVIALLSKYSFPILLIHMQVVASWTGRWGIWSNLYGGLGILISLVVTTVLSFVEVFAIENSLVYLVQKCYEILLRKANTIFER